jgi:hypothetical protein
MYNTYEHMTYDRGRVLPRIECPASTRASDGLACECRTFTAERAHLAAHAPDLREPFDVSAPPPELAARLPERLGLP